MIELLKNNTWLLSPWAWALLTGSLAMWLLVPRGSAVRWQRAGGGVLGVISVGLLAPAVPAITPWTEASIFWLLAAISVVSAAAMISMRSPVFSAIWFAMTLLGVATLFFYQGAQLIGVATIAVYAGAIVVMFLFLIMLAQPEGHEYYDRISWDSPAALASAIAGAAIVLMLTTAIIGIDDTHAKLREEVIASLPAVTNENDEPLWQADDLEAVQAASSEAGEPVVTIELAATADPSAVDALRKELTALKIFGGREVANDQIVIVTGSNTGTQAEQHVATLGGVLFSRYLLAVELAGTLLLVALVGAVAIVMQGREPVQADDPRQRASHFTAKTPEGNA